MKIVTLSELMAQDYPPDKWIVDKLIPADAITIVSGPPESFKTWCLLHLADAVSNGYPLFGNFETTQHNVLFIDEETNSKMIKDRALALGIEPESKVQLIVRQDIKIKADTIRELLSLCKEKGIELMIIDSFVRINPGDENDATKTAATFNLLRKFVDHGISVVIAHHNRKPGITRGSYGDEMRGSSDILAAVDCQLSLNRPKAGHNLIIVQNKLRIAEKIPAINIEFSPRDDGSVTLEYKGTDNAATDKEREVRDAITDILKEVHNGVSQKEILRQLSVMSIVPNSKTLSAYLSKMKVEGIIDYNKGKGNMKLYYLLKE